MSPLREAVWLQGRTGDRQIVVDHVDGDRFGCVKGVLWGFRANDSQNERGFGQNTGSKSSVDDEFD